MKTRLQPHARTRQIVAAIREGHVTSQALALLFGSTVKIIASDLSRLEAGGHIMRAGKEPPAVTGRPSAKWRAV